MWSYGHQMSTLGHAGCCWFHNGVGCVHVIWVGSTGPLKCIINQYVTAILHCFLAICTCSLTPFTTTTMLFQQDNTSCYHSSCPGLVWGAYWRLLMLYSLYLPTLIEHLSDLVERFVCTKVSSRVLWNTFGIDAMLSFWTSPIPWFLACPYILHVYQVFKYFLPALISIVK